MGHPPYSPDLAPCDYWLCKGGDLQTFLTSGNDKRTPGYCRNRAPDMLPATAASKYLAAKRITSKPMQICFSIGLFRVSHLVTQQTDHFKFRSIQNRSQGLLIVCMEKISLHVMQGCLTFLLIKYSQRYVNLTSSQALQQLPLFKHVLPAR